ncbi:MAG: nitroreductase [Candidatus Handelsmanbacteria bacterium RIFCSPLOWO2_12_FULL_64_10]|uniref:Nitroreductase n=1 Tax=Handelsmanbacteria sp. (strain RIFCSPLOWO2_12_FULL_64_10) TaxID=1817868 RepID=A0A1F6D229_HANXR|nr:MAG: nitroreductase [Candidatus Handelsmanbacteria bacterium RIFCSPLOWO2_12_FULL_64_10]
MGIYEIIRKRWSVRAYLDDPVPDEVLNRLLEAARWAPSARNLQPYRLIVVQDRQRRQELARAANEQLFIAEAPVVIAAVSLDPEHAMSCGVPAYAVDAAIAVDHLILAAAAEGLGTCWIGAFSQDRVRRVLGVPETCKVVILTPLGYPADEVPVDRSRKPMSDLVCYERFG